MRAIVRCCVDPCAWHAVSEDDEPCDHYHRSPEEARKCPPPCSCSGLRAAPSIDCLAHDPRKGITK